MILLFSFIVIAVVAFFQYRNGLFTSVAMLIQVLLAGLIAFGFWEPVADELDLNAPGHRAARPPDRDTRPPPPRPPRSTSPHDTERWPATRRSTTVPSGP